MSTTVERAKKAQPTPPVPQAGPATKRAPRSGPATPSPPSTKNAHAPVPPAPLKGAKVRASGSPAKVSSALSRAVDSVPLDPTISLLAKRDRASLEADAYANAVAAFAQFFDPVSMEGCRIPDGNTVPTTVFQNKIRVPLPLCSQISVGAKWCGIQITQGPNTQYRYITSVDEEGLFVWSAWQDNPAATIIGNSFLLVRSVGVGGYLVSSGKPLEAQGLVTHGAVVGLANGYPNDNPDTLGYFTQDLLGVAQVPVSLEGEAFSEATFAALDLYNSTASTVSGSVIGGPIFPFQGTTAEWSTMYGAPSHAWIFSSPDPATDVRLDLVLHSHYEAIPIQTVKSLYNPMTVLDAMPQMHEVSRQILSRVPQGCSNRWLAAALSAGELARGVKGRDTTSEVVHVNGHEGGLRSPGLKFSPWSLLSKGVKVVKNGYGIARKLYQTASPIMSAMGYSLPSSVYAAHLRWAADKFEGVPGPARSPAFDYLEKSHSRSPLAKLLAESAPPESEPETERTFESIPSKNLVRKS